MDNIYDNTFNLISNISNNNILLLAFEHHSKLTIPNNLGKFMLYKTKKFGNTSISYYKIGQINEKIS
jgi:16S rRNA G966 N2-methylase RsmD